MYNKFLMRIVFFGTTTFSLLVLCSLIQANVKIVAIFTHIQLIVRLFKSYFFTSIEGCSFLFSVPVFDNSFLFNFFCQRFLLNLKSDFFVVVSTRVFLQLELLKFSRFGCVNLHMSVIPRFIGSSPVYYTYMVFDSISGISLFFVTSKLDQGPILSIIYGKLFNNDSCFFVNRRFSFLVILILCKFLILYSYGVIDRFFLLSQINIVNTIRQM